MSCKASEYWLPHGSFVVKVFPTVYALRDALPRKVKNVAVHGSLDAGEICAAFILQSQPRPGIGKFGSMLLARSSTLSQVIHESVHVADCYLSIREAAGEENTFDVVTEKRAKLVGEIVKIALKEKRA